MAYQFKTTNIKGKNYVEVNERIKYFRTAPDYAGFALTSTIINLDNDSCVVQAIISDPNGRIVATGFAQEDRTSSHINKTSYVENCETSAWGRALANLGIGIDTSIASSDEVAMAVAKQARGEEKAPAKAKQETSTEEIDELYNKAILTLEGIPDALERGKMRQAILKKYGNIYSDVQVEKIKSL